MFSRTLPNKQQRIKGTISILSDTIEKVVLKAKCNGPCWLLISENYDRFWHASLDNDVVPLLRANYILRAIPIKAAGEHIIELKIDMKYTLMGFLFTIIFIISVILWMIYRQIRKSNNLKLF